MRTITIPMADDPIEIIINNTHYVYKAGETVNAPDEVAAAIEQIYHMAPGADNKPAAPEVRDYPYDVVIKVVYDTSDSAIDTDEDPELLKGDLADTKAALTDGDPVNALIFSVTEGDDGIVYQSYAISSITLASNIVEFALSGLSIDWNTSGLSIVTPPDPPDVPDAES